MDRNSFFSFDEDPLEEFDSAQAGDEVAYEDGQQEMFGH